MVDLKEEALVVKSNSIIEARYIAKNPLVQGKLSGALTPREMDLLTVLFTTIGKDSDDIRSVRIKTADLIKLFGLKGKSGYEQVEKISQMLLMRVISLYDPEEDSLTMFQILSRAKYYNKEGYAEFRFHEELKPHLLNIKQYAKYFLRFFLALNSFYSKRVYELVTQYKNTQNQAGEWQRKISIKDLREYVGIQPKEYNLYGHLKKRVIASSVSEITKKTDIELSFEEEKLGRKVEYIIFKAKEKENQKPLPELPSESETKEDFKSVALLTAHGVGAKQAQAFADTLEYGYIEFVVKRLEKTKKTEKIENSGGWLYTILSARGFEFEYRESQVKEAKKEEERKREARKKELSEITGNVRKKYKEYFKNAVNMSLAVYEEDQIKEKQEEFIQFLESKGIASFTLKQARKEYWFSALVFPQALEFFQEVEGDSILLVEQFAKKMGVPNYQELKKELEILEEK